MSSGLVTTCFAAIVFRSDSYWASVVGVDEIPAALKSFVLTVVTSIEPSIGIPISVLSRMNEVACGYWALTLET